MRQEALSDVLSGKRKAREARRQHRREDGQEGGRQLQEGQEGRRGRPVRRAGPGEDRQDLRRARGVRQRAPPGLPGPGHRPEHPGPGRRFDGPLHNQIPEPDRSKDNSTIWQEDYSRQHYQDLYFSDDPTLDSVKNYYEKQSSGRYSVDGTVSDWVKVKYNEARYGRSNGFPCGSNVCSNSYNLVQDGVNSWYDSPDRGRQDAGAGQGGARAVRPVGPQRLRR